MGVDAVNASHDCAARGCTQQIPLHRLMCGPHWRKVPRKLRQRVWGSYRPGQEIDHNPSGDYVRAVRLAVLTVAEKEHA